MNEFIDRFMEMFTVIPHDDLVMIVLIAGGLAVVFAPALFPNPPNDD
jgi:hypothetical protein